MGPRVPMRMTTTDARSTWQPQPAVCPAQGAIAPGGIRRLAIGLQDWFHSGRCSQARYFEKAADVADDERPSSSELLVWSGPRPKGRFVSAVETVVGLTNQQNEGKKPNDFWSEWQDSNLRPLRPERSALPG